MAAHQSMTMSMMAMAAEQDVQPTTSEVAQATTTSIDSQASTVLTEEECEKLRQDFQGFVVQLQRIIESVDTAANLEEDVDGPSSLFSLSRHSESNTLLQIARQALQELNDFLETPFGENASILISRYAGKMGLLSLVVNMTQVTTGIVVVNLFLDLAEKLLKVKEDEFKLARLSIENSLQFIKEKLPEIKAGVQDAGEVFRKIREAHERDDSAFIHRLNEFMAIINTTKLNIKHCDEILASVGQRIEEAMCKIQVHFFLNGFARGVSFALGLGAILFFKRTGTITTGSGIFIGIVGLGLVFTRIRPRYRKEREDFLEYKVTQDDLKKRLYFLSEHLKGHEDVYEEYKRMKRK